MAGNPYDQFDAPSSAPSGAANPYDQFDATPGGAAMGNPSLANQGAKRRTTIGNPDSLTAIGGATALGGVAGAFAPEILTVLGAGAAATPFTAPAAPFLFSAGSALRGARLAGAASGAISGLAGETAGQVAEQAGAPQVVAEGARVAGGLVPELKTVGGLALKGMGGDKLATMYNAARNMLGKTETLSAVEQKAIDDGIASLRQGSKSDAPFQTIYQELENAARNNVALGEQKAKAIIKAADDESARIISTAQKGEIASLDKAKENLAKLSQTTLESAKNQRLNIGADREMSDIGGELREIVTTRNADALAARKAAWDKVAADRNTMVSNLENTGVTIDKMPEFEALKKALKDDSIGRSQPVKDAYEKILNLLKPSIQDEKLVLSGQNLDFQKGGKVTFQQMDDVRRLLGEIFSSRPPEGYEAIKGDMMRKYYSQISDIQKKFAGGENGPQAKLLNKYASDTEGLQQFSSKLGAKLTALDRNDPTKFANDESMLPSQFFKSRQSFNDLVELTGDKAQATKAALDYATNQLRDKSQQQVRAWMTSNRDFLSAAPEVRMAVSKYADTLENASRVVQLNETRIGELTTRQREAASEAERLAKQARSDAERVAKTQVSEIQKLADELVGNKYPAEVVPRLFKSGSRDEVARAAVVISMSPQARESVVGAVRQMLANDAERSTANLVSNFEKISRRVQDAGLMTQAESDAITQQLRALEKGNLPEAEKLGAAKRIFLQSFGGYAAGGAARGGVAIKNMLSNTDQQQPRSMVNQIPGPAPTLQDAIPR